ncbi:HWE histidine kinase domain-containing protein [Aurantimonas sp. C2-6-R+9]|uniref:HWE histidine kinase domain-containing protein n=1 Tax=unclassified Aurantimonas TaxID=2638230 RepID=UPI002E171A1D|nr:MULTISPECIES: HWE histidine kinase domain-containing protein [unclassified Aurantimonas]MEC5291627.1 HWE histidine kinase domain-containing protein [Aurantimonas sp. C2-3-R2]MEC5322064.1 HWE histidine kinase domain-containing protein [Aurantimonas sp. A3-2-R12]MEC5381766.1 HWE histidine kinase domain-containing protein [Aurantimonas sp. C2-6-R+9]MEC5412711.1 HWE histidine kinase domain-containing protein [Aurantimonas sp. C2-4-R8]
MSVEADVARSLPDRLRSFLSSPRRARWAMLSRAMRRPPLLAHLVLFALIVLIPALLFSAFLVLQFSEQQREIAAAQVNDTAEIVSNAVDRDIYGMITSGKVLASSPSLVNGQLAGFHERTVAALRTTETNAELIDPALGVVVSTLEPYPPAPRKSEYTKTIEQVFKTRRPLVSGVFFGARADRFMFHVAVPVMRDQTVTYVLVINKAADALDAVIANRNLPREWSAIIKDAEGRRVFAAVTSEGRMEAQQGISYDNPSIMETLGARMSNDLIEASTVSSLSNWTTTVAVPNAVIVRPALRSWILLMSAGILLLLFSIMLGIIFGRRIAAPILQLSQQAEAIGKGEPAMPFATDIAEIGAVSKVLAQASRERREAEEQNRFLMREMTHRAKNQYALIAAIARRAAKESANTKQFLDTLSEALSSLARSADLLAGSGWESAMLADLVDSQLKAFGAGGEQIELDGPAIRLNSTAAQTIGLALHELATNAAKYGSLSVADGTVKISWSIAEKFELIWREIGGPTVVEPKHAGFGTLITQKMTSRGLGGAVEMNYAPAGVVWKLVAPKDAVIACD